jgi:hypothetical protein
MEGSRERETVDVNQWIGLFGKILTGKPHDLHGKIESFRLRFSQQNQSIESTMHPSWDPSHPWAQNLLALLRWETSAGSFASDFCTTSAAPPWLHSSGDFRDVLCNSPT